MSVPTKVAITSNFEREDGSGSTGWLIAELVETLRHEGLVLEPVPIRGVVGGATGGLTSQAEGPFELYATDDVGTTGAAAYCFTLQLDGQPPQQFYSAVPHASAPSVAVTALPGWPA